MISKEKRKELQELIDPRLRMCYDYILVISESRVLATHGGNISLITINGKMLFTADSIYLPEYPSYVVYNEAENVLETVYEYVDEYLIYIDNGKKGIINYDGEILTEAKYSEIEFDSVSSIQALP